jgi:hypothetical protein
VLDRLPKPSNGPRRLCPTLGEWCRHDSTSPGAVHLLWKTRWRAHRVRLSQSRVDGVGGAGSYRTWRMCGARTDAYPPMQVMRAQLDRAQEAHLETEAFALAPCDHVKDAKCADFVGKPGCLAVPHKPILQRHVVGSQSQPQWLPLLFHGSSDDADD